jgi:hypothetical protein
MLLHWLALWKVSLPMLGIAVRMFVVLISALLMICTIIVTMLAINHIVGDVTVHHSRDELDSSYTAKKTPDHDPGGSFCVVSALH